MTITTTTDWMNALAEAIEAGDESKLDELRRVAWDWMMSDEDRAVLLRLLDAVETATF